MIYYRVGFIIFFICFSSLTITAQEVDVRPSVLSQCGDIIEGTFTTNFQSHLYGLSIAAGDTITARLEPLGRQLQSTLAVLGPTELLVITSDEEDSLVEVERVPEVNTGLLSANGIYTIWAENYTWQRNTNGTPVSTGGIGVYTLYIGCTLRNGTVIEPGDNLVAESPVEADNTSSPVPPSEFSGFGFPGLAPIDFTNGVTIPLTLDIPNAGSISTGFEGIFGYSFSAEAGQVMNLDFVRTDGNLNLGIALISADNQVAFQASLVTSNTLSTELTIPVSGEYTLGVFRIELISPTLPENTTFTLTGTLN